MGDHQVPARQQRDHHRNAQDEFQRGPQHAHQLNQPQRAGDVLAVEPLEQPDLRLLTRKGTHQTRPGVVLLGLRRDFRKAGLNALEAVVNLAPEVLHQDARQGHRCPGHHGQPGADPQQEKQRAHGEEDGVRTVHQRRAQQHAHGIQIVRQPGHDVARAIALIEARILPLQLPEEVVAQVELDLPRYADQNPALGIEKDALHQGDRHQQPGV